MTTDDLVRVQVFTTDLKSYVAFNKVYRLRGATQNAGKVERHFQGSLRDQAGHASA